MAGGEVRRDGKVWRQEFARGVPVTDLEQVGTTDPDDTGTTISFLPDAEVFEELDLARETLRQRLRETAFLTRGLRIRFADDRRGEWSEEFLTRAGSGTSCARQRREGSDPPSIVYFEADDEEGLVEIALQERSDDGHRLLVRQQHQHH